MSSVPTNKTVKTVSVRAKAAAPVLKEVRKRDGSMSPFDRERIKNAIQRAMIAYTEGSAADAERVTLAVEAALLRNLKSHKGHVPSVEEVQDTVESELIYKDFAVFAKSL